MKTLYSPELPMGDEPQQARWLTEAKFFDSVANERADELKLDPIVLARYGSPSLRRRFHAEYRFHVLGPLNGRDVLDAGCGEGSNSMLLAKLGARVTGIDISPGSVALARKKAAANEIEAVTRFICSPLETADLPPNSFDIIWADNILHHLIAEIDSVLAMFVTWVKPGGTVILTEPINLNRSLRHLRLLLPVKTRATPDERPLELRELKKIHEHLPNLKVRHFSFLGRVSRFVLCNQSYERSSWLRRTIAGSLALIDYGVLSLPYAKNLAGVAVMSAVVNK